MFGPGQFHCVGIGLGSGNRGFDQRRGGRKKFGVRLSEGIG